MDNTQAIALIKQQVGNPEMFLSRKRGFLDYKFGELAEYRGFAAAVEYAESVLRWHDSDRYTDTLLLTTYRRFRAAEAEAEKTVEQCQ